MLTRDRTELMRGAAECFNRQTYPNKQLVIWDNSEAFYPVIHPFTWHVGAQRHSIGQMRNAANSWALGAIKAPDIFATWDDDDFSNPNRLTEQVALLKASGADAVGYSEMLFERHGEAWLYSNPRPNYALGTSLCFWRKTWERSPFTDGPKAGGTSEYHHWFGPGSGVRVESISAMGKVTYWKEGDAWGTTDYGVDSQWQEPRMIARIHGQHQSGQYDLQRLIEEGSQEWKLVPAWDSRVRDILEGK